MRVKTAAYVLCEGQLCGWPFWVGGAVVASCGTGVARRAEAGAAIAARPGNGITGEAPAKSWVVT